MKKIIIINHYGATPNIPGPTKNFEMAKFFAKKYNCKTEFWICGYSHYINKMDEDLRGFKIQKREKISNNYDLIKIKSTAYKNNSLLRQLNITIFDIISAIKILLSRNIDVVIMTTPPVTLFNVIAAKLKGVKIVSDVQDLWPLFLQDMGMNNKLAITYMNLASNNLYKSSDAIAAVSSGMLNYTAKRIKSKPMWVSPLGIDAETYKSKTADKNLIIDKKWKNDFKVIYLGVHGRANDLFSVLETVKEFNESYFYNKKNHISFIFIGDGDIKEDLKKYACQLRLSNVYFEDPVPNSQVPDYLVHADICLTNLMKIESFKLVRPNKLFQYMGLGKPIISGIWGEFQSIIEKENSGIYVDFTSPEEAAFSMNELIKNKELLNEMGKNGLNYIKKDGDRKKIFADFYNHLMNDI